MKTLREVAVGSTCKVKKLHGEGAVKRRIMDMGITKGVEIKVQKRLRRWVIRWRSPSATISFPSARLTPQWLR